MGCKPKQTLERDNVQINVATSALHEIRIDEKPIPLADTAQKMRLPVGQHKVQIKDASFTVDLTTRDQVLINPSADTIIMEEVVYNMVYNGLPMGGTQSFQSPIIVFSLGGMKYAGPYKLFVNESIIKGWDFGLGQKPFSYLGWDNPEYKGAFSNSYFKISTVSEFRASNVPLNYINEWIEVRVSASVASLDQGHTLTVEQGNFLVVSPPKGNKVSVCKVSTDINDDVVLREVTWYNKEEHGKIIRSVATLGNCLLQEDKLKKKKSVEIVTSDKTHQPHLRIIQ